MFASKYVTCPIFLIFGSVLLCFVYQSTLVKRLKYLPSYKIHRNFSYNVAGQQKYPKRILFYTPWFGAKVWWGHKDPTYEIKKCNISNCVFSNDRSQFEISDAVFFHARDMIGPSEIRKLHKRKPRDQIWIWNVFESQVNVPNNLHEYNGMFDWTATHRVDSELFLPYFRILPLQVNDSRPEPGKNFADGKDKMILAIISDCVEERLSIVRKIKEHVSFDLYGGCADKIPNNSHEPCVRYTTKCNQLKARYKFYFAMENSFCIDYITEKYFENGLLFGAVPIVFGGKGGPNFNNTQVVLPKSYINVLDFKDMKSLGDYLNYLNSNDTAYNEYHAWRYKYKVEFGWTMCDVCEKLWNSPPKTKTGMKISEFYSRSGCVDWNKALERFSKR